MKIIIMLVCLVVTSLISYGQKSNTEVRYIASEEFKKLNLPFSEAVIVDKTIYLSGQVGILPGQMVLAEGGIKGETKQAFENIKLILESNGSSLDNIVKCTIFLADISEWAEFNSVYVTYFPKNKPARSAFGTNGLALGARLEIECIAILKK